MQQWTRVGACLLLSVPLLAHAAERKAAGTIKVPTDESKPLPVADADISLGGYVKFDAMFTSLSDGDVSTPGGLRDLYNPNAIPVAASGAESSHSFLDAHAKESRLFFKIDAHVYQTKLGGYLELDFLSNPGAGTEIATNAYNPGLRRAFVTYNNWLFGQDWSTFQNMGSLPDSVDYLRWPTEGTVFVRQPQVRYTWAGLPGGDLQVSLENPETLVLRNAATVSGATPVTGTFVTGDAQAPDLVVRYNFRPSWGDFAAAALVRQLQADGAATGGDAPNAVVDGSATGAGLSVSGKIPLFGGRDDVRFEITGGDGIGRYVALAAAPDAVADNGGGLATVAVLSGFAAYRHAWTPRWRSSLMAGVFQADHDAAVSGAGVTKSIASGRVNLMYSPVDKLTFGLEFTHSTRKLENGNAGDLDRLQFGGWYAF
ncbi:MAG TPA: DcaP family trimeric outer membrane transporter [Candidatus Binatia bacterium]|nr:DcaP family trimeric outer membrane transporter [Candidatus Binatia bacterium]